ncbi:hypothetical protein GCM10022215_38020 [Nocardioides fonticola]|uniref:Uncharacterized protein n=1 Tax=Nocardioides fonticola TaxID=450363 RepID=A0ABP7XZJ7_9ACTN
MQNTRSRVEATMARMLATSPPPVAHASAASARVDLVYLTEDDQRRLDETIREP